MKKLIVYHFNNGVTLRDGRPLPSIGQVLTHDGPVIPCSSGLHGSEHPFDALQYALGGTLDKCELWGEIKSHGDPVDKVVGANRVVLKRICANKILLDFARWNCLELERMGIIKYTGIVKKWLNTGDEAIRNAAWVAAWVAARDAFIKKSRAKFLEMVEQEFAK